ncbi:hypothetical protein EG327_007553 [Venturia inaequalis]|uniref:Uncharacterized protein n=1 Tax=Venturia inaequalis TaxID=5025 RepID=A0A8H3UZ81_VENIN|nr:hypothetical protein EG327_007553 [Venturia inaequalis]
MFGVISSSNFHLLKCLIISFLCIECTYSLLWDGPAATSNGQFKALEWTPKPTELPSLELIKRKDDPATSVCGYINAISSAPLACPSASACAFNTAASAVGCCASSTVQSGVVSYAGCNFFTACYDYGMMGSCDAACQKNSMIRKCTADNPSCYKWDFKDVGHRYYGCTTSGFTSSVNLHPTSSQDAQFASGTAFIGASMVDPLLYATIAQNSGPLPLETGVVGSGGVCTWGCWGWDCSPDQPCKSGLSCYGGYCKDKDPNNSTSPTTSQAAPTSTVAAAHNSGTDAVAGVSIVGVISLPAIVGIIVFFMR